MTPIIITIPGNAMSQGKDQQYPGWVVPDTSDTLAIDQRFEADLTAAPPLPAVWAITHLPTGFRVSFGDYTRACYMDDAVAIAQRFYGAAKALGSNLDSTDPAAVTGPIGALAKDDKTQFWRTVAGWPPANPSSGAGKQE